MPYNATLMVEELSPNCHSRDFLCSFCTYKRLTGKWQNCHPNTGRQFRTGAGLHTIFPSLKCRYCSRLEKQVAFPLRINTREHSKKQSQDELTWSTTVNLLWSTGNMKHCIFSFVAWKTNLPLNFFWRAVGEGSKQHTAASSSTIAPYQHRPLDFLLLFSPQPFWSTKKYTHSSLGSSLFFIWKISKGFTRAKMKRHLDVS